MVQGMHRRLTVPRHPPRLSFRLLVALLTIPGLIPELAAQSAARPLVVGIATGYPPYQFVDALGRPAGLDAELTRLVFAVMAQDFVFRQDAWDTVYLALAHRVPGVDLLCGAELNPQRQKLFDFSLPCYQRRNVVFVRADSPHRNLADLAGLRVTGDRSSFVEQHADLDEIRISNTASKEESFRLLMTRKVVGVIAPLEVGIWFSKNLGMPLRVIFDQDPGTPVAFAVGKNSPALADRINQALRHIKQDGRLEAVLSKYGIRPL